jgi:hypothetical protein
MGLVWAVGCFLESIYSRWLVGDGAAVKENTNSSKTILVRGEVLVKPNLERPFPLVMLTSIMLGNESLRKRSWLHFLMRGSISLAKA